MIKGRGNLLRPMLTYVSVGTNGETGPLPRVVGRRYSRCGAFFRSGPIWGCQCRKNESQFCPVSAASIWMELYVWTKSHQTSGSQGIFSWNWQRGDLFCRRVFQGRSPPGIPRMHVQSRILSSKPFAASVQAAPIVPRWELYGVEYSSTGLTSE